MPTAVSTSPTKEAPVLEKYVHVPETKYERELMSACLELDWIVLQDDFPKKKKKKKKNCRWWML